jgi:hypothetical protein
MRFPEVRTSALDERDICTPSTAEFVTKTSDEFESASASADDDDAGNPRTVGHPALSE